jgi:hypothetical protein
MKKQNETWTEYLSNKAVRPKTFNVTMRRNNNGEFEIVPREAQMLSITGARQEWVPVSARAIAKAIRDNGVVAR